MASGPGCSDRVPLAVFVGVCVHAAVEVVMIPIGMMTATPLARVFKPVAVFIDLAVMFSIAGSIAIQPFRCFLNPLVAVV